MNQNIVDDYVARKQHINKLDEQLKQEKEDLKPIEKMVLKGFEDDGVANIKTSDGVTVYLQSMLWARRDPEVSEEAFLLSLRENGLDDLIQEKVNTQTLSAVMREQAADYLNLADVPTPFGVVLSESTNVRVRGL